MSPTPDRDDPTERQIAALVEFMDRVPMFQAVAPDNPDERRLWRACELCTFLEYRLAGAPAPHALTDADIHDWARRGLAAGEALGDPDRLSGFRPYWLAMAGRRLGLVYPAWGALLLQALVGTVPQG